MTEHIQRIGMAFTPDLLKACLVLTLLSASVVIGLFSYVGVRTRRAAYRYWTIAWLFYAVFVAAMIAAEFIGQDWHLATIPTGCVALSALFMVAGNMEVVERPIRRNHLMMGAGLLVAVNFFSHAQGVPYWFSCPAFWALALAALYAGILYYRVRRPTLGVFLVTGSYCLWSAMVVAMPLVQHTTVWFGLGQFLSSVCLMGMAVGVILDHQIETCEQKYRMVLDGTSDSIFMVDLQSLKILDTNQSALRFTRRGARELTGMNFMAMCPDLRSEGNSMLDHRKMFAEVFRPFNEVRLVRADGVMVRCEGDSSMTQWQSRAVVQVRLREVTGENTAGQVVRRAEKMSSLGQLIAGVAHELNNPLAVVMGSAQIMAKLPSADRQAQVNLQRIVHEAERASRIVRDLLAFARPCEPQMVAVDVNELIRNVLDVRQRDLKNAGVEAKQAGAAVLPRTKADAIQIEQVVNNLITNAVHAMATQPVGQRILTVSSAVEAGFVRISVKDSGVGIPGDHAQKVFEPFFTTKGPGKGTGLGLSISQQIMQEHHGRLWFESKPGQGATFFIDLPLVEVVEPVKDEPTPEERERALFENRSRRLLIIDDEPGIREVLSAILDSNGYQVQTASNGVEALERMVSEKFDMIITDMCMPEMDGERLYENVLKHDPALAKRMIFVTGDTVSSKSRGFLERTGCRWLSKPFNIRDVEEVVDQYLREHLPITGATSTVAMLN